MSPGHDVVGLSLQDERIDAVVIRRGPSGPRVLGAFGIGSGSAGADDAGAGESAGTTLRARLGELGVRPRRVHVGIPRRLAVVKAIELPTVAGADLRRMVGFELERHLPFPPSDALFDFDVVEASPGRPVRVLVVAIERRVFERIRQLLREMGAVPRLIDVGIHSLALLAAGQPDGLRARGGRLVLRLEGAEAELAIVRRRRLVASRAFPVPPDPEARARVLAEELRRSVESLEPADREALGEVTLVGDAPPSAEWTGLPVRAGIALRGLPVVEPACLPALAMALRRPTRGGYRANLVPEELRPRPFPWRVAVTAALAVVTLALGAAIPVVTLWREERALAALERTVARLAPDVRRVEQLAGGVERARREMETLRGFETQGLHVLPVLRELTETLPADVWLTSLSADRNGVELAGFAGAASQLIPLLEASPTFDRVEFTSPVTKGRDREQFRLKAGWERAAAAGARPAAPARAPRAVPGG